MLIAALIMLPYRELLISMFILTFPLVLRTAIDAMMESSWAQSGLVSLHVCFAYPAKWLIFSCVMLLMHFCSWFFLRSEVSWTPLECWGKPFGARPPPEPPDALLRHSGTPFSTKRKVNLNSSQSVSLNLKRLALLSALGVLYNLPMVHAGTDESFRRYMKKRCCFHGYATPSSITDPDMLKTLKEYLQEDFQGNYNLIEGAFHCIVDTGCSTSASPHREDFETYEELKRPVVLHGINGTSTVTHGGIMRYQCINTDGEVVTVRFFGFHDKNLEVRLLSPQSCFFFRPHHDGKFTISWAKVFLEFNNGKVKHGKRVPDIVPCYIDKRTFMPMLTCFHDADKVASKLYSNNGIVDVDSDNLTAIQRQLLRFHFKLGHLGFKYLKWLLNSGIFGPLGVQCGHKDVPSPKCQACLQGGQQKNPIPGNIHRQKEKDKLKREQLIPGQRVFSDQYVSSVSGRNYTGRGHAQTQLMYKGGTVFVDAASSYMSIHHQIGFTAVETIKSKLVFEREAASVGNQVKEYNTDNGVYTSKEFTTQLENQQQAIRLSGVGAHHQNGPAENAIKNISRRARIYMLHAAIRWPDHYSKSLWPLAMSHAVHMHNHIPRRQDGLCPVEIWSRSKSNYSQLTNAHPWGCPVYVLDPRLQDGHKIPRWEPRSRRGVFVGVSPLHASSVALILNPNTNRLSPQFHCVFDDYFETVHHQGDSPPPQWDDLVIKSRFRNDLEGNLDDTWDEFDPDIAAGGPNTHVRPQQQPRPVENRFLPPREVSQAPDNGSRAQPPLLDVNGPTPNEERPSESGDNHVAPPPSPPTPIEVPDHDQPERPGPRRSTRVRKPVDRFTPDKAHGYSAIKAFTSKLIKCICVFNAHKSIHDVNYQIALAMDPEFGVLDGLSSLPPDFMTSHPWMLKSKKGSDPDTPTIKEALTGPYRSEFLDAMSAEIRELENHGTWTIIKKSDIPSNISSEGEQKSPQVVPLTWAYKVKRWPSGEMRKIKARLCVRGDLQTEGVDDAWETYAPVASWSSIRMLTTLSLQRKWVTKQIDFSNAFVQATLDKDVYVSLPPMFDDGTGLDSKTLCLKLNKSLYGMREAPKLWSDHLEKGLKKSGFSPSHEDPGIYYGRGMAIAVYVDDVLFFGPDSSKMEDVINELQAEGFELKREKGEDDSAYSFLGISITEQDGMIKLSQHGLIKKFLKTVGMENCNAKQTPCSTTPLGTNPNGPPHDEEWEYASAVGMLMYLAGNAHPKLAFAVHQCARFTHCPKATHTLAIKHIAKYLKEF